MTTPLSGARVLVADDQSDVARTLCAPLRQAGARLRFVTDGHAAWKALTAAPYDLVLIDLKMPPEEWGGLWLLQQRSDHGLGVPALVLTGEGAKAQTIAAHRLGADDWVEKDAADIELVDRCIRVLTTKLHDALEVASSRLPTPLAACFANYTRATDPDKRTTAGLRALEAIFRFTTVLGLASHSPVALQGFTSRQLSQPSMGTWHALCGALTKLSPVDSTDSQLLACLMPEGSDRRSVQDLIALRNDIAHREATADSDQQALLDKVLRQFAHRAVASWPDTVATPTAMTFDGHRYTIEVLAHRGTGEPIPNIVHTDHPLITSEAVLLKSAAPPLSLAPWIVTHPGGSSAATSFLVFDGASSSSASPEPCAPLRYCGVGTNMATGGGTWRDVLPWIP
ncbi:response regulator transcription factor [Streptomyces lydicus]